MKFSDAAAEDIIRKYCEHFGISRVQYEAEGILQQENIDALLELRDSEDEDPTIPLGLPGAGKRRSELAPDELELLCTNEVELDDLIRQAYRERGASKT